VRDCIRVRSELAGDLDPLDGYLNRAFGRLDFQIAAESVTRHHAIPTADSIVPHCVADVTQKRCGLYVFRAARSGQRFALAHQGKRVQRAFVDWTALLSCCGLMPSLAMPLHSLALP
jgi:hypothetical protein